MKGSKLFTSFWLAKQATLRGTIDVHIDTVPRQTLVSFGASGAWWPNDLIHFPEAQQKALGAFLFSEDGLHLSSYRYNIGGDGGDDTQQVTTHTKRVESFLLRNGTYDWSRDHAGVTFLEMAQQYEVPFITFFVNAAPSHVASNGAACGWNMTSDKVTDFADYISTVLSHWIDRGIDIKYISPMNEPDSSRSDCSQEGMIVYPFLRGHVIKTLRTTLDSSPASRVDIIADETSRVTTQALVEDPIWLRRATPYVSNIAVHNYDFPTDDALALYYQSLRFLTSGSRLPEGVHFPPVKFTETCCSTNAGHGPYVFGVQYDPTMRNALIVARYIWQFLTIVQAESFDWWTAVTELPCSPSIDGLQCVTKINETAGFNSGLVYIDPRYNETQDYNLYTTKRAFMLKHFAFFHRPGSVRYDVKPSQLPYGVNAIATKSSAVHGRQQTWSVTFMNNQTTAFDLTMQAPSRSSKLLRAVETTNQADWAETSPFPVLTQGRVLLRLAAESLHTFQFSA